MSLSERDKMSLYLGGTFVAEPVRIKSDCRCIVPSRRSGREPCSRGRGAAPQIHTENSCDSSTELCEELRMG